MSRTRDEKRGERRERARLPSIRAKTEKLIRITDERGRAPRQRRRYPPAFLYATSEYRPAIQETGTIAVAYLGLVLLGVPMSVTGVALLSSESGA